MAAEGLADGEDVELEALHEDDDKAKPIIKGQKIDLTQNGDKAPDTPEPEPDQPTTNPSSPHMNSFRRCLRRFLQFIGRGSTEEDERRRAQLQAEMTKHLDEIANLEQTTWEKSFLYVNLVIILAGALAFYIYFTINPFTIDEIQTLQNEVMNQRG